MTAHFPRESLLKRSSGQPGGTRIPGILVTLLTGMLILTSSIRAAEDPLPSWNQGASKTAILEFVTKVTTAGGPDFVPVPERIATFDNDGTLWCEMPLYVEGIFSLDRVKLLSAKHPKWKTEEPFAAILANDLEGLKKFTERDLARLVAATHSGMTNDQFMVVVGDWLKTAEHPRFHRLYTKLIYQPMLELLAYLRSNDFEIFIVSGGGVEFMRNFTEECYDIPPERVIGSSGKTRFEFQDQKPVLLKLPELQSNDDKAGKAENIGLHIGRRPLMAFGNSDGDLEMLQWTTGAPGARFGLIVHHTDAVREYAYDRDSRVGHLEVALENAPANGWTVVSMKKDWARIFPNDPQ